MILYLIVLFLILYTITNHFRNKIRNFPPSPFPKIPIIGHLHLFKKPLHRSLARLSEKYGPILYLQFGHRRVFLISSPTLAEECFTKNDIALANRPRILIGKHFGYNYTSIIWAPYGDLWRNLRKLSGLEILSSHRLQLLSTIRSEEVKLMLGRFYKNKDGVIDLKAPFFELMLNVMMRMISGKKYYGENVEEVEEVARFRKMVTDTLFLANSNVGDYLPLLGAIKGEGKKFQETHEQRDGFIEYLIAEHRKRAAIDSPSENDERNKTLIPVLLSLQKSDPEFYTDETIKSLLLALLSAGTDTSSATMEWGISLLVNNPEILKKAQNEIDTIIGHDQLMTESDVSRLPYFQCVINEVMRMYPTAPLLLPHESLEECHIGGYRVRRGTMLLVNQWAIQNDPKVWDEPKKFKPERFIGFDAVKDGFKLMPFGSGRRKCPGEGLALRMIGLSLGSIIQCFDWERVGKEMVDMKEGFGLTMPKANPIPVKYKPRPCMVKLLSQI
ncbi:cytochrome P450 81Q32-like [Euphorbia lathyris]|uniref:cytochrome P450 81Q32-like n=1 Tax=Euphorbia lathyris TaxID=212925 RepID=UPI0033141F9F